jgi:hypothetical protein
MSERLSKKGSRHLCIASFVIMLCVATAAAGQSPCAQGEPRAVRGVVVNEEAQRQPHRVVRLQGKANAHVAETGGDGRFVVQNVCPDTYQLDVVGNAIRASVTVAGSDVDVPVVLRGSRLWSTSLLGISIGLFAAGLLLFRHHNIVRVNRELLAAQVDNLSTRIPLESDSARNLEAAKLAQGAIDVKQDISQWWPWEWFFWSRGRELAGWIRLHEVERQMIAFLVPEQRVVERAVYAETELRQLNKLPATTVADRMRQTIQEVVASGNNEPSHSSCHALDHLKQQLAEGLAIIYDERDTKFAGLMEWHNKAMFLAYLSLISIAVLGLAFGHEELFLVGAVGGLMSRMTRSLFREDVPSDYGASWTTLFLSPLMGAIAAWVGITLLIWLREMNVLDEDLFDKIDWDMPMNAIMVATAFALGFSERLFTSLLSKVEGKVQDELAKPPRPPAPPAPLSGLRPLEPATSPAPADGAAGIELTRSERIVREIDLTNGERAAFVGSPTSAARAALVPVVGATAVFDATFAELQQHALLDGVIFDTPLTLEQVDEAAVQLAGALRPDGRVVVLGSTPTALFDADAPTQRAQGHAGPAVVKESFVTAAGLVQQEPPEKLGGTDPVEWIAAFVKPAPGGEGR